MAFPGIQMDSTLRVELTALGRLGDALGEAHGKQVFVFGGIPGELVTIKVLQESRQFLVGQIIDVLRSSPHRVSAPCPYFGHCTGCQWQHIDYPYQLELKRQIVCNALARMGVAKDSTIRRTLASPQVFEYRNHARFTISKRGGFLGFVNRTTRKWVHVMDCLLMAPWINRTLKILQGNVEETSQLSMRYGINTATSLIQPTLKNPNVTVKSGQKYYMESLLGREFRVSSPSFFQVNTPQAEQIALLVQEGLALEGNETVVDAFAGVGTFAVLLASHARRVIAIEESASALEDARHNVAHLTNVELRRGRTEKVLEDLMLEEESLLTGLDAVVLDPPRTGCESGTLAALIQAEPRRIVYVSCDPDTLARDLKTLCQGPYRVDLVQPVDMFPQTHHVECVVTLVLDSSRRLELISRRELILASGSPRRVNILSRLGLEYSVSPSAVVEPPGIQVEGKPTDFAMARALAKAKDVASNYRSGTVMGFDTVVALDGNLLGKPRDTADAVDMLRALRGREHEVVTGLALIDAATTEMLQGYRRSHVVMRVYTDGEIEEYVSSGDPFDKAGAYGLQNTFFNPAQIVRGCYLNVVGLPVCTLMKLLSEFGVAPELNDELWPELNLCEECAIRAGTGRIKK